MESLIIIILGLAFYWLMIETNWQTLRLPSGAASLSYGEELSSILSLVPTLIIIGFIDSAMDSISSTIAEHEEDMKRLWELYGRKQPAKVVG